MKKWSLAIIFLFALLMLSTQFGCSKSSDDNPNPGGGSGGGGSTVNCSGNNPGFAANVLPLIQSKCGISSDCHASGSTNSGGPLTTYSQINARASNIRTQVSSGAMPKTGSLTTTEKNMIICWVNNGANNN